MEARVRILDYAPGVPAEQEEDTAEHQFVLQAPLARVRNFPKHPAGMAGTDMGFYHMAEQAAQHPET